MTDAGKPYAMKVYPLRHVAAGRPYARVLRRVRVGRRRLQVPRSALRQVEARSWALIARSKMYRSSACRSPSPAGDKGAALGVVTALPTHRFLCNEFARRVGKRYGRWLRTAERRSNEVQPAPIFRGRLRWASVLPSFQVLCVCQFRHPGVSADLSRKRARWMPARRASPDRRDRGSRRTARGDSHASARPASPRRTSIHPRSSRTPPHTANRSSAELRASVNVIAAQPDRATALASGMRCVLNSTAEPSLFAHHARARAEREEGLPCSRSDERLR
jgi:hypothetical protein